MPRRGELSISGKWKDWNRRTNRQAVYSAPGVASAIADVGEQTASVAKDRAQIASNWTTGGLVDVSGVANLVGFKDVRRWQAKKNASVSKSGDQILVGLVVSDDYASMALEFGVDNDAGSVAAAGFMRQAAQKMGRAGIRFIPALPGEQQKSLRKGQRLANKTEKNRVAGNKRRSSRRRQKAKGQ
jgi:hypothetical protein